MPNRYVVLLAGFLLSAPIGLVAQAQSPSCDSPQGSGACLPWGLTVVPSEIYDLSRDGSAVAGQLASNLVYHWDLNRGLDLLSLPGNELLLIDKPVMSGNGLVIAGRGTNQQAGPVSAVFRWDVSTDTTIILPTGPTSGIDNVFPGRTNGTVTPEDRPTISVDGNTIVGGGFAIDGFGNDLGLNQFPWIFRWTASGGTSDIPQNSFSDQLSDFLVSGDGISVVADLRNASFTSARWRPSSVTNLGTSTSAVRAVSYDGEVIAGTYNPGPGFVAYRWTQAGGVQELSTLVSPRAISDDGNVITSLNLSPPPPFAFTEPWIWDPVQGDQWMLDYLSSNYGIPLSLFFYGSVDPRGLVSGDGNVFSMAGADWITKVSPIEVVFLGDSFTSGEGVPDFEAGTDFDDVNECHRSLTAYSTLVRPRTSVMTLNGLATSRPGYTWDFLACSGAVTDNVLSGAPGTGQWPATGDGNPQLSQGVVDSDTDVVVISIGGNDALFADVVFSCVALPNCQNRNAQDSGMSWQAFLPQHINTTVRAAIRNVYQETKTLAPNAAIVVIGYPQLVGGTTTCGNARGFNLAEQAFTRQMSMLLTQTIREVATEVGVHFVPVDEQFGGHDVCSQAPWINGVHLFSNQEYTFHPNQIGHQNYASAINDFLNSTGVNYPHGFFDSGMPKNPPPQPL